MDYTTKRLTGTELWGLPDTTKDLLDMIEEVSTRYNNNLTGHGVNIFDFAENHYLNIAFLRGRPVGFMAALITSNAADRRRTMLKQLLLYASPGSLCAHKLLKDFIDFGRCNTNDIFTVIGEKTNIKPRTLERLGFKKLETVYRMEVPRV